MSAAEIKVRIVFMGATKPFFLPTNATFPSFLNDIRTRFEMESNTSIAVSYDDPDGGDCVDVTSQPDLIHLVKEASASAAKGQLVTIRVKETGSGGAGTGGSGAVAAAVAPSNAALTAPSRPPPPAAKSPSSSTVSIRATPSSNGRPSLIQSAQFIASPPNRPPPSRAAPSAPSPAASPLATTTSLSPPPSSSPPPMTDELRQKISAMNTAVGSGDLRGAIKASNAVLEVDRTNVTALYNRATARAALNENSEAINDFSAVISANPQHAMAYLGRGNAKVFSGDVHGAAADFEKMIAIAGVNDSENNPVPLEHCVTALHGLAVAHSRSGAFEKAVNADGRAIDIAQKLASQAGAGKGTKDGTVVIIGAGLGWSMSELYYSRGWNRARLAATKGDAGRSEAEAALSDLSAALALDQKFAKAYQTRGQIHSALCDWSSAMNDYQKWVQLAPSEKGWHQLAIAAHNLGKLKEAIAAETEAIKLKPTFAAYYNRALGYAKNQQLAEAASDISNALTAYEKGQFDNSDPNERVDNTALAWAYCNRGIVHAANLKWDEALKDWGKSIELKPTVTALNARANYYYGEGRIDDALADWSASLAIQPNYIALLHRANHYVAANQPDKAIADYDAAIALLEIEARSHDKAIADAAKIQLAAALSNRAAACCLRAQFADAIKNCNRAIEMNPNLASAHHNKALALEGQGNLKEAVAEHKIASSIEPHNPVYQQAYQEAQQTLENHIKNGTTPQPLTAEQIRAKIIGGEPIHSGGKTDGAAAGNASKSSTSAHNGGGSSSVGGSSSGWTPEEKAALKQLQAEEGLTDEELAWLESDCKELFQQLKKRLGPAYRPGQSGSDSGANFKLVLTKEMKERLCDYRARVKKYPVLKRWKPGLAACLDTSSYLTPLKPNFAPLM